jgi:REP element-mobilizing transposase RayT
MSAQPLYTLTNTTAAYQLNWSLSVFGNDSLPSPQICIELLREAVARDHLKILDFRFRAPNVAQFFISSQPSTNPSQIIRSVKGRWQNISRPTHPIEFRRNYRITAVGTSNTNVLDAYVRKQPKRHLMADDRVQSMFESLQCHDEHVDLDRVMRSSHGEYRYGLHVVIESAGDWHEVRIDAFRGFRDAIIKNCAEHGWRLSRIGLLANHVHVLVGPCVDHSPADVALSCLNAMASTQGMKQLFRFSFFVGTFGEYDRGAIWNAMGRDVASIGTGPMESLHSLRELL